jgi:hypothetical protein
MMRSVTRVFVPRDAAALAVGADEVAAALVAECARRGRAIELVRNGSRGLFWLEPLVEVATPAGRHGLRPGGADDVPGLFAPGCWRAAPSAGHGPTDAIPYLKRQQRLTFARIGLIDPLSLATTRPMAAGGPAPGFWHGPGETSSTRCCDSGCAGAAARRSRPASSGGPWPRRRPRKSTSSATPTRATPAPLPTAC